MKNPNRLTFRAFYKVYLDEHRHPASRLLHYIGSWLAIFIGFAALLISSPRLFWLVPILGYGFAWVGHFFFEKKKPATFKRPFFSLAGDWVMWWQITTGKLRLRDTDDT